MRILVTANAAVGHFLPMAATVTELVAQGHEVRVGCPESFAPFVRRAGFDALGCESVEVPASLAPSMPPEDDEARLMWAVTSSWPSDCRPWFRSLLRQARQWRPDVVVVEPVEHAGRIVAAALGLPLVVHGWGFTLPSSVEERAASGIADLYDDVRATPPTPALVGDLGPATVQAPDCGPAERYRYRPFSVAGDPLPPPRTGERRILVTLGTYANTDSARLIRAAVAAALRHGTDVVAVLGHADRGSRETFPRGATVLDWVDLPAAIAGCDLVVHHGGAGTLWTALGHGKPAVVLPQAGDQFRNAAILAAAGAAIVRLPHQMGDLDDAIVRGSQLPTVAERARAIAVENAALPDVAELARRIVAL